MYRTLDKHTNCTKSPQTPKSVQIKLHLCLSVMVGLSSCKPCCGGDQVDCHKKKAVQAAEGFKCISMFGGHCRVIEVTKILSQKYKKKNTEATLRMFQPTYIHIFSTFTLMNLRAMSVTTYFPSPSSASVSSLVPANETSPGCCSLPGSPSTPLVCP